MDVSIRIFRSSDLPHLQSLTVQAFEPVSIDKNIESHFGVIGGKDWAWRKSRHIAADAERAADGIFVAEIAGEIVGDITTWADRESSIGNIPNLAVAAHCRGQGIGRALIAYALEAFRRDGLTHARIETLDQNEVGQSLYPGMGFREVARQIHYCANLSELDL